MKTWTNHEIKTMKESFPLDGAGETSRKLGRSISSINNCARRLGLYYTPKPRVSGVIGKLVERRMKRRIPQEQVSKYLCIADSTISRWELGEGEPPYSHLVEWAAFFDLELTLRRKKNPWEEGLDGV